MQKFLTPLILFIITLFITACGGGSTSSSSGDSNGIKVKTLKSFIDAEEKNFYLEFSMINQYQDEVIAELSDLNVDLNNCIVSSYQLNTDGDILTFDEPDESYIVKLTAKFSKACTPTGYRVDAKNYLIYNDTSNKSTFQSDFTAISPTQDVVFENKESLFEYDVLLVPQNGSSKIELNSAKRYKLSLGVKEENRTVVNTNSNFQEENVNHIRIKSNDSSKVQLILPQNYQTDHEEWLSQLDFDNINDVDLFIKTFNTSGVVNLDVLIEYTNNQGEEHQIETTTSLTVLSGEPTAFSINSAGISYDTESKWFENKFLISASDKYNNPINIPSKINVAAMADFRDNHGQGNRILHGTFQPIANRLSQYGQKAVFQTSSSNIFENIDIERDYLLLFGDITTNEALGKWDIEDSSGDSLFLRDIYHGETHENLGFAVGHNYIKETCSSESKEWELKIDSTDQNYQLDEEGKTYVTLKFPPYLIGKTVALSINFSGKEGRSGEVDFETLHSFQGVKTPDTINIDVNTTTPTRKSFTFEVDTGTEDRYWVHNAKVFCNTKSENIQVTEFRENSEIHTLSDCQGSENGDVAYWDITLELIDLSKSGSFSFEECQVHSFTSSF